MRGRERAATNAWHNGPMALAAGVLVLGLLVLWALILRRSP